MPNTVIYYQTADGRCDVLEFLAYLKKVSRKAHAKCLAYIGELEDPGPPLQHGHAGHVDGRIWELRPELGGTEYRFLYAQLGRTSYIILTGFKKDYQRLRQQDIDRARNRLIDYERRQS